MGILKTFYIQTQKGHCVIKKLLLNCEIKKIGYASNFITGDGTIE